MLVHLSAENISGNPTMTPMQFSPGAIPLIETSSPWPVKKDFFGSVTLIQSKAVL